MRGLRFPLNVSGVAAWQEAVEEEPLGIETEHLASTVPEQLDLEDTAQNPLTQGEALAQPRHDLSEPLLSAPETLEPAVKHDDQPLDVNQDQRWEPLAIV